MASTSSLLTATQRYAAGALFAVALRRAHAHQTRPFDVGRADEAEEEEDDDDASLLWTHHSHGLLRPVFRFLGIDSKAWTGIEETANRSFGRHHVEAFIKMIAEENQDASSDVRDQEFAFLKAVDAMAKSFEATSVSEEEDKARLCEYERECRERASKDQCDSEQKPFAGEGFQLTNDKVSSASLEALNGPMRKVSRRSMLESIHISDQRKIIFLYELLSACVADATKEEKKKSRVRSGYDARHRAALRLLATWLDIEWIKMEAMEVIVACSAVATIKEGEEAKETDSNDSRWSKWKRGGIIGAAALTGGALLAVTGGLAAPAIAAGFGALAPTLGTLVPIIGASGFAAAASAAGSVAGSVAVAASFGAAGAGLTGTKVARRLGSVEEFEFVSIGKNHNQGRLAIGIMISGLVFEQDDFVRPWDGREDNLERYVLQWESENLIAVSTAIQDWITSRVALELMKHGAMMTVLSTLMTALAWPAALLSATDFIDSKWTIAIDRSDKAGVLLADVLMRGQHGNRPVTLCGFSLGARVIFKCLQHMAEKGHNEGIVERVILLGAPIPLKDEDWEDARKLVSGRFVNVYSTNDWMLGVAFRASLLTKGLAGIQPVEIPGIENVDVTELIDGHSSYLWSTKQLLELLEIDCYYPIFPSPPSRTQ